MLKSSLKQIFPSTVSPLDGRSRQYLPPLKLLSAPGPAQYSTDYGARGQEDICLPAKQLRI